MKQNSENMPTCAITFIVPISVFDSLNRIGNELNLTIAELISVEIDDLIFEFDLISKHPNFERLKQAFLASRMITNKG